MERLSGVRRDSLVVNATGRPGGREGNLLLGKGKENRGGKVCGCGKPSSKVSRPAVGLHTHTGGLHRAPLC